MVFGEDFLQTIVNVNWPKKTYFGVAAYTFTSDAGISPDATVTVTKPDGGGVETVIHGDLFRTGSSVLTNPTDKHIIGGDDFDFPVFSVGRRLTVDPFEVNRVYCVMFEKIPSTIDINVAMGTSGVTTLKVFPFTTTKELLTGAEIKLIDIDIPVGTTSSAPVETLTPGQARTKTYHIKKGLIT